MELEDLALSKPPGHSLISSDGSWLPREMLFTSHRLAKTASTTSS